MQWEGFTITVESIQIKGREFALDLSINELTAINGRCKRRMCQNGLVLWQCMTQWLPKGCDEKLLSFQHIIKV
jgi:hypothetical protein